ncbi:MAG: hypothetical protein HRU34_03995 [Richelia sp.]|nr:hypothetical protein [Richelia sp.]
MGVAESGDDFTKFSTISQWFQTLIHPALMQHPIIYLGDNSFSRNLHSKVHKHIKPIITW